MGKQVVILLDTHVWVWSLFDPSRLPSVARTAINGASVQCTSAISVYEVSAKVALGKWPEMKGRLDRLISIEAVTHLAITPQIADLAGSLDWEHRDPFDRLIAATAINRACPLVSKDREFDALECEGWKGRLWS